MSKSAFIKRHNDPRENAREIYEYLEESYGEDRLFGDPVLDALYNDATGLLTGMSQGTIKTGQPRIVEQLIRIVQNYPNGRDPSPIIEAIAAASEFGLTADGHSLPGVLRASLKENER